MEIKENDQKCLNDEWGINDKSKLRNISKDGFKVMEGNDAQNSRRILTRQLQKMLAWMIYYNSENDDIRNTNEEWESNFNEDILTILRMIALL